MKRIIPALLLVMIFVGNSESSEAQKRIPGTDIITSSDLSSYVTFISSPLLKGRADGEPGLDIAQQYIISEAKLIGLKPANGTSYLQSYLATKNSMDHVKTKIQIAAGSDTLNFAGPILQLFPSEPSDFKVSGDIVFAGYGLKQDKYGYNDFDKIETTGKILLVMMGSPKNSEGKIIFEGFDKGPIVRLQMKITPLAFSKAKAIMIVEDPKSGFTSIEKEIPEISGQINPSMTLKGEKTQSFQLPNMPKIMFISRTIADAILSGSGKTLEGLQNEIDSGVKPHSFVIPGKQATITEVSKLEEVTMNNVAAFIEGSDPVLRKEYIVFSCHADHIGTTTTGINPGADDNASGCAALLSIAKAYQSLDKKPLRSILFLWFSGEEVGLFGSKTYVTNPLVPLNMTVADLNMDMIGRVKSVADTAADHPMTGPKKVFVITDYQSKELIKIADDVDKTTDLDLDYSLAGRKHPLSLLTRSDHYNFVRNDIPVLFFTTGLHTDYHTPGDVVEKIDFNKMELVTRTMYQIGYNVANRKTRITVDNPFSKW
jgi:hypothetical protein